MRVEILEEAGILPALYGIGLSFGKTSKLPFHDFQMTEDEDNTANQMWRRCLKLAPMEGGHNKFLRQCMLWVGIDAPLYWWKQFDTYKVATVAQSESTMHTLTKNPITQDNFEDPIQESTLNRLEWLRSTGDFSTLNNELPLGWLQYRVVSMNYETLRNIIRQRKHHKLPQWHSFIFDMAHKCQFPEFIADLIEISR